MTLSSGSNLHGPGTGRFAYIVLAHRNAAQVARLVHAITTLSPRSTVVVHWSAGSGTFGVPLPENAVLVRRPIAPAWGHWSLVEAVLKGIEEARRSADPDWVALVSGSDYPVRPLAKWERDLAASDAWALLDGEPAGVAPIRGRPPLDDTYLRYNYRWRWLPRGITHPPGPEGVTRQWRRVLYRGAHALAPVLALRESPDSSLLGVRRRSPGLPGDGWPVHKGSQWVALQRRALDQLHDPRVRAAAAWFRPTLIPDEAFFQTVAVGLGWPVVRGSTSRALFGPAAPHPDVLVEEHLSLLADDGPPFARKVVPGVSDAFVAEVDRRLGLRAVVA